MSPSRHPRLDRRRNDRRALALSSSWARRSGVLAALTVAAGVLGAGAGAGALGTGCGNDNEIVGGSCAPGYVECDNRCISVATDPINCGACGHVCASGSCENGACAGTTDAKVDAPHDGTTPDGPTSDGTTPDGTTLDAIRHDGFTSDGLTSDGFTPDGTSPDAAIDGSVDGSHDGADAPTADSSQLDGPTDTGVDQCAPPYISTTSCGSCTTACVASEVCAPTVDGGVDAGFYACAAACPKPFLACEGTCIDVSDDPVNCGACGKVCPSGICVKGLCAGSTSGDIVVIGHDYATANVHAGEAEILANAVFLPPNNPLRVISFEQYANGAQVLNAKTVLKQYATSSGRTLTFTP